MKKKITSFLLLTCMLVGMIGSMTVYAGTSSQSAFDEFYFNFRMIDEYGDSKYNINVVSDDYKFIRVVNGSQQIAVVISKSSFTFSNTYITDWLTNDSYVDGSKSDTATCQTGNTDDAVIYMYNVIIGSDCTLTGPFFGTLDASNYNGSDLYQAYYEILCDNTPDGFEKDDTLFDEDTATYDKDLGYLQNVKFTAGYIKVWDELLNKYVKSEDFSGKYRFQWGNLSTSGFDLTTANTYVRLYSSVGVYSNSNGYEENLCSGFPKNFIHQYVASDLQLIIDINDFLEGSQKDFEKLCEMTTMATWLLKGYYRQDTVYLQIVNCDDSGSWTYGGFLKVTTDSNGDITGTPVTPDGGRDIDGGSEQDIPSDEETGVEWSDVWDNDDDEDDDGNGNSVSFEWSDIPDLLSDISSFFNYVLRVAKDLISQVGDFPALFSKVLAFLPDAVQQSITAGFIIAIILRLLGR